MLLEGAIGDAYGAGFEFVSRLIIRRRNKLEKYKRHPFYRTICGHYTDDTQMALALAELIVEGIEWTRLSVANKFVEVFKRDMRQGYAFRFFGLLQEVNSGQDLLDKIVPNSERNGSAMRAYPIGILDTETKVLDKTELQARITHDTEWGVWSAQAIALSAHFFLYKKGAKVQLTQYLEDWQQIKWPINWQGEVPMKGKETVEAVLSLVVQGDRMSKILMEAVNLGGDADTVASLALALSSVCPEIEKDLPDWMFEQLENGPYGRSFIEELDQKFLALMPGVGAVLPSFVNRNL
ncbi:MAG TPA: ADP-ribosylglycohydrolase family protein [Haliscomenobacter sp.]|uniref:ADP-ribosylglycohydrolase family protein n=1 Tax=Haliscomenobacter sp. TaxID=2717303 RepID=UPI002C81D800|nr:ADP-ribosylglycohydrolase family protein [Haliscomenobacter sp.]HOY17539.1 ADP-ribosylglycohydrolase family protein [Haliscomenobacter sp.]HPH17831.1 ADP-ribosylglycohydrolase family protein [Haliscomenobacter sp.]